MDAEIVPILFRLYTRSTQYVIKTICIAIIINQIKTTKKSKFPIRVSAIITPKTTLIINPVIFRSLLYGNQKQSPVSPNKIKVIIIVKEFIYIIILNRKLIPKLLVTFSIRIVADCEAHYCQVTRKLKRATTLEFTNISAIIFIHC